MAIRYPDAAIRNALVSDARVTSLLSHRVFSQYASPADQLPFVVLRRTGVEREQSFAGPIGLPKLSIDVEVYGETYESARDVADAVRRVLDGYGGFFDNTEVKNATLNDEQDELVQLAGSEKPPAFAIRMSFDVLWQET